MNTETQQYLFAKLPLKVRGKIEITAEGCWLWQGEINRNGYGRVWIDGVRKMVHRFVWHWLGRELLDGHVLDHICKNRSCCNPTHLSQVTIKHNTHRGDAVLFKRGMYEN